MVSATEGSFRTGTLGRKDFVVYLRGMQLLFYAEMR